MDLFTKVRIMYLGQQLALWLFGVLVFALARLHHLGARRILQLFPIIGTGTPPKSV
jgi:hypothetical protein